MLTQKRAFDLVLESFANLGMIQSGLEARDFAVFIAARSIRNILELGTGSGGMMYLMDKACRPGIRITMDRPWENRDPKLPEKWDERFKLHLPHVVELIGEIHSDEMRLRLVEALTVKSKKRTGGDPLDGDVVVAEDHRHDLDLIFQDSDHSAGGSMRDFKDYSPYLKKGGYFVFHDVLNGHGTQRTYEELCKNFPHWVFAEEKNLFGIGVLQI